MSDPYRIVRDFENALCEYTGAPYCVTTTSCTTAILMALRWFIECGPADLHEYNRNGKPIVSLPRFTYVGVAMSVLNAGAVPEFDRVYDGWEGEYRLGPYPLFDSARWFRGGMFKRGYMMAISFHHTKHLGLAGHGGALLLDDPVADRWLRKCRFDGRTEGVEPKDDIFDVRGIHAYMTPAVAAEGLMRLAALPRHNEPLPNSDYPDLSLLEVFK